MTLGHAVGLMRPVFIAVALAAVGRIALAGAGGAQRAPSGIAAGPATLGAVTPTLPITFLFAIEPDTDPLGELGDGPTGVAAGADSLYVTDRLNGRVTRFDPSGQPLLAWGSRGTAQGRFGRNLALSVAPDGTVLVADADARRVQRFSPNGKLIDSLSTVWGAEVVEPQDLVVAPTGTIYLTDGLFQRVVSFVPGQAPRSFGQAGDGPGQFNQVSGIAVGRDGTIWVADGVQGTLQQFSATGEFMRRVGGGDAGLGDGKVDVLLDLSVDPRDGSLVVLHGEPDTRLMRLSSTGAYLATFGAPGTADGELDTPLGLSLDASGRVSVADAGNGRIQMYAADGRPAGFWGKKGDNRRWNENPDGLAFGPGGETFYESDVYLNEVRRYNALGQLLGRWGREGMAPGEFDFPTGLAVASDGSVIVADQENHRVQRFTAQGGFLGQAGGRGSGDGQFNYVGDVAVGSDDTVYVADIRNQRVAKLGLDMNWQGAIAPAVVPFRLAAVSDGSLVVVQRQGHRLGHFAADGRTLALWGVNGEAPGELSQPDGVAVSPDGWIYLAEPGNRRIDLFSLAGDFVGTWGERGRGYGQFGSGGLQGNPSDIALSPDGLVYASDSANHRVQVFGRQPAGWWRAAYFANSWLAGSAAVVTRTTQLSFTWDSAPPFGGLPEGEWSARFGRRVNGNGGRYVMSLRASGGARLFVGDALLVDDWNAARLDRDLLVELPDGLSDVQLEYNHRAGAARLELSITPLGGGASPVYCPYALR